MGVIKAAQWCSGKFGAGGTLGGLGRSPQRGPGAQPLVGGSRGRPPEAESFFVLGYPKGGAIFHLTSKFRKLRKPHISSDVGLTGHGDSH